MRVVVLGFDGVEPTMLSKLIEAGELPAFASLRESGIAGEMDSTTVPISAMAWSSFATGVNPGKHGVFDFVTRAGPESTEFDLTTANHRQAPAMWDYLGARDERVGVIGMPVTYPVDPVDGFMISGYPTPHADGSVWPPDLADETPVDPTDAHARVHFDGTNREAFLADQFRQFDAIERLHEHALADESLDVLVTVFKQTDDVAHVAWDEPPLYRVYRRADEVLRTTRERLAAADEEYLLLVVSDHGFGPVDKTLFLNNVLRELDYESLRNRPTTAVRAALSQLGINMLTAYRVASALGLGERLMSVGFDDETTLATLLYGLRNALLLGPHDIDAAESDCFSRGNYGQVFVDDGDPHAVAADLESFTVDGEQIVEDVHLAAEEFHGDATDIAPDLMIETPDYRYLTARGFALATDEILTDHIVGRDAEHKQTGIFFATGSAVSSDPAVSTVSLDDVLPTILHALGHPVPAFLDGTVLDVTGDDPDPTVAEYDLDVAGDDDELSDEERDELRSQLESLGYAS